MKPMMGILTMMLVTMLGLLGRGAESLGPVDESGRPLSQAEVSNKLHEALSEHMQEMSRLESNVMAARGIEPLELALIGSKTRAIGVSASSTNAVYGEVTNKCRLALRLEQALVRVGQPITVRVTFQNLGSIEIPDYGVNSPLAFCRFRVLDLSGKAVPRVAYPDWPPEWSISRKLPDMIPPNEEADYEFRLDHLFKLNAGTYSIYVEKDNLGTKASAGPAVVQVR